MVSKIPSFVYFIENNF